MPDPDEKPPREWVAAGAWPDGELRDEAPIEAPLARHVALQLRAVLDAHAAEVLPRPLRDRADAIVGGTSWPDVFLLLELEDALGCRLWPDDVKALGR